MTVIAYSSRHRVMAADSRCTYGLVDDHFAVMRKIHRLRNRALVGVAGDTDLRDLLVLLRSASPAEMPSRQVLAKLAANVEAIVVFPDPHRVYAVNVGADPDVKGHWFGEVLPVTDACVAMGSGAPYAIGAMLAGASPREAVRITCKRSAACALPVQWRRVA